MTELKISSVVPKLLQGLRVMEVLVGAGSPRIALLLVLKGIFLDVPLAVLALGVCVEP